MLLVLWKKWLGSAGKSARAPEDGEAPERWVELIHEGHSELRNELIHRYHPYILKITSRFSRRFIDPQHDDEFSVAIAAFDEAITRYDPENGRLFLGFAETVVTRRLIDYARQEKRHAATVPYSAFDTEYEDGEAPMNRVEIEQALDAYGVAKSSEDRVLEITMLTEELQAYGIGFGDLADHSPRHQDSREALQRMGRTLAGSQSMLRHLREKKQLPIKELCEAEGVSRKTAERNRKYIIAVTLIASGPYPSLRQYIGLGSRREGELR